MKTTMIMLFLALLSWGARAQLDHSSMGHSENSHSSITPNLKVDQSVISLITVNHSLLLTSILDNYLAMKDALVDGNGKKAASSGKLLFDALGKFDFTSQSSSKQKELKDIMDDAKENAEHISVSGSKIDHQREHFDLLGGDIKDLIAIIGADRTLYQLFCSRYNNNKGGKWLSTTNKDKNPFFGDENMNCAKVLVEIKVK